MKVICSEARTCKSGCGHNVPHEYTQKCDSVCWLSKNPHGECREVKGNEADIGVDEKTPVVENAEAGAETEQRDETGAEKDKRGIVDRG